MSQRLLLDSNREIEKRLIIRACDTCRKRKIRCEPISDLCAQCIKSKTPCHFTPISVLRSRRRLSRDRRVEKLERKLARMEGQLRLPQEGRQFPRDIESGTYPKAQDVAGFNKFRPTYLTSHASLLGSAPTENEESARVSKASNSTTPDQQSIPSPSLAFLADSMLVLISGTPRQNLRQNTNSIGKETQIFQELPSKEKALHLITIFFQGVNAVHPYFDRDTFMSKFDSAYGLGCTDNDPGWWAALNVVLALACQYGEMPIPDSKQNHEACGYFQNALAATTLLIHTISNPSSHVVQADLNLLEPFLNLLGVVARSGVNDKAEEMYQSSIVLFEQARMAVEHSGPEAKTHWHMGRRDPGARESVEDFLERMEHIRSGDSTGIGSISGDVWQ